MLIIYRIFINLILIFIPLIFIFRLIKKKETIISFKEKIGFFQKKKKWEKLFGFMEQVLVKYRASYHLLKNIINQKK